MPTSVQSHARSHALLLLQKLLNLRDGASPLTLVLDTLEQSGRPVIREFMVRAKACFFFLFFFFTSRYYIFLLLFHLFSFILFLCNIISCSSSATRGLTSKSQFLFVFYITIMRPVMRGKRGGKGGKWEFGEIRILALMQCESKN